MTFNKRVTIIDGWAVTDNEDGSQTRARLEIDQAPMEPERGDGMWNEGVSLVREYKDYHYIDIDSHPGLEAVMERVDTVRGSWVVYSADYGGKDTVIGSWDEDMEEFVSRYLRIFWGVQHAKRFHVEDYRNSYPVWGIAEGIEDSANIPSIVEETFREYAAWATGDVYVVVSEHRALMDEEWISHDWPVGGYYGDDQGRYGVAEALGVSEDLMPENVYTYTDMT